MKKMIFMALIFIGLKAGAQDLIIKMDKTEIKSKVLELTDDVIKYKKFEKLDGPTYSIKKSDVFMIIYKDGSKEYMDQPVSNKTNSISSIQNSQPSTVVFNSTTSNNTSNSSKTNLSGPLHWSIGSSLSLPLGTMGDGYSLGYGLDVEVTKLYSETLVGFANIGYVNFAGKSFDAGFGTTETIPDAGFFTLLAGAKYRTGKMDIGGGLGYGSSTASGGGGGLMFSPIFTYNLGDKYSISGSYNTISTDGGSSSYFGIGFKYKW